MTRLSILPALLLAAAGLQAHSLWVFAEGEDIEVVFEHSTKPGEGAYNKDILAKGETWVRRPGQADRSRVKITEVGPEGARYLVGKSSAGKPRSIEHFCLFGIYQGRLDYFYGKHLDVESAKDLASLARTEDHPIDIAPLAVGNALEIQVLWQGQALADHRIAVIGPDGEETRLRTNPDGVLRYEPPKPGRYGFWSVRVDDDVSGTHEGEPYSGTMHAATTSLVWPLSN